MKSFKFFIFIFFISAQILDSKRTPNVCNHDKPNLHFPFKLNSFCKQNQTMISFRGYGELGVKSVLYDPNKLTLTDPKDCVFEVFLNLNLDSNPFRYYHVVKNYTYLNCSMDLSGSFERVPCLSGSRHHVYVVESFLDVPSSCNVVKTVSIPFAYSSYVSDDSFGLDLTWDSSGLVDFEEKRGFGVQSIVEDLGMVVILVLVMVGLGCVKAYCWKQSRSNDQEWEKLIGDLETLL